MPVHSQTRTQDDQNPTNGVSNESEEANGGDGDGPSDEENEEELSASSIEVLGTLLRYIAL